MIRVLLPSPLAVLARTGTDMTVDVEPPVTQRAVLDAIEARAPAAARAAMRRHLQMAGRRFQRSFGH